LVDGILCLKKADARLAIHIDANNEWYANIQAECVPEYKAVMEEFIASVSRLMKTENIYKGKRIEFSGALRFLNVGNASWQDIVVSNQLKAEIKQNTVEFLLRHEQWGKFGILPKRGIILAGPRVQARR